jgi:hypothetical protein
VKWKPPVDGFSNRSVVRAIAVEAGVGKSEVATHTIVPRINGLPVLSITGNSEDLFGANDGIYVVGNAMLDNATVRDLKGKYHIDWWDMPGNYRNRGGDWQREVNIEYIEDGQHHLNIKGGVRLNGNATRAFPQKSLRLYAPDSSSISHSFFGMNYPTEFEHLILRNSGNDWGKTMFRDILANEVMRGSNIELQPYKQVTVYINGEYWGIHNLRPRLNENYLAEQYETTLDELTILEKNAELYHGKEAVSDEFKALISRVKTEDLSEKATFKAITKELEIDNLIDYLWAEIYLVNTDWPGNNIKYFKLHPQKAKQKSTPWRFILMDTDYGFGYTYPESYETNMFKHLEQSQSYVAVLFQNLCQNEAFCQKFVARGEALMETQFNPARINRLIDQLRGNIAGEMESHVRRWRQPASVEEWENEVEVVRRFVAERPAILKAQTKAYFSDKIAL